MVSQGNIYSLIMTIIMMVILFSVAVDLVPTGAQSVDDLLGHFNTNTTLYGTGPSSLAGTLKSNIGFFWVAGFFLVIVGLINSVTRGGR